MEPQEGLATRPGFGNRRRHSPGGSPLGLDGTADKPRNAAGGTDVRATRPAVPTAPSVRAIWTTTCRWKRVLGAIRRSPTTPPDIARMTAPRRTDATAAADPAPTAALIVTLRLDAAAFARLDALRRAHFPPGRNLVPAHLTLFRALPAEAEAEVAANLETLAAGTPGPLPLRVAGLRSLGRGVAFSVESEPLARLRSLLAAAWHGWLAPQDRQAWRPHVTVQNKVEPAAARALLAELQAGFAPWEMAGEGLLLWRYQGGPWDSAGEFPFGGTSPQAP